jgi:hypothetical protein
MEWSKIIFNASTVIGILIVLLPVIWNLWKANQKQMIETVNMNMKNAAKNYTEKIIDIKDELKHLREMHEDHYEFQRLQIQKTTAIEINLNNTMKTLDKLYCEHMRIHSNGKYNDC